MAVAALTCGIVGSIIGTIPILALPGLALGVLAVVFGFVGRKRATARGTKKGMATAGIVLGLVAITLAIIGFVIVSNAFNDLDSELNGLAALIG